MHMKELQSSPREDNCFVLTCDHGGMREPVILDMKGVLFRPSHYSLWVSACCGMEGDWILEGCQDGSIWDILHHASSIVDTGPAARSSCSTT